MTVCPGSLLPPTCPDFPLVLLPVLTQWHALVLSWTIPKLSRTPWRHVVAHVPGWECTMSRVGLHLSFLSFRRQKKQCRVWPSKMLTHTPSQVRKKALFQDQTQQNREQPSSWMTTPPWSSPLATSAHTGTTPSILPCKPDSRAPTSPSQLSPPSCFFRCLGSPGWAIAQAKHFRVLPASL